MLGLGERQGGLSTNPAAVSFQEGCLTFDGIFSLDTGQVQWVLQVYAGKGKGLGPAPLSLDSRAGSTQRLIQEPD